MRGQGRHLTASRAVAEFDSASSMLAATAAALRGERFERVGRGPLAAAASSATALAPRRVRELSSTLVGGAGAAPARRLGGLDAEDLSSWVVDHYPRRRYPAVAVGASNGAAVHLWAALGVPWLPSTLLVPVRHRSRDLDDPSSVLAAGVRAAAPLLAANPDLAVHQMHDPNHDRLMSRTMAYLRLKRLALGRVYERFLADSLAPGGEVLLLTDRSTWPVAQVGERHVFQFGGAGGASVEEYLDGGPRVRAFLAAHGSAHHRWRPPRPDVVAPEAEWGSPPQLAADVRRWAAAHGHRVRELVLDAPEDLSGPVADLHRRWYAERGLPGDRLLVESFIVLDPVGALRSARVPYWTVFPTRPSLERLQQHLAASPAYRDAAVVVFPHGTRSIGYAPPAAWQEVLGGARLLGGRARRYPAEFAALSGYGRALRRDRRRWPLPEEPLPLTVLDALSDGLVGRGGAAA